MKLCKDIQSLLLLSRSGERTAEEESAIAGHLASCAECRRVSAEIAGYDSQSVHIRGAMNSHAASIDLVPDVLQALNGLAAGQEKGGVVEQIVEWLIPALATPVTGLLILFFFLQARDLVTISRLERVMAGHSEFAGGVMSSQSRSPFMVSGAGSPATAEKARELLRGIGAATRESFISSYPVLASVIEGRTLAGASSVALAAEETRLRTQIESLQNSEHLLQGVR